jgi:hypothetical protein
MSSDNLQVEISAKDAMRIWAKAIADLKEEIERLKNADKEKLAAWMMKNGFATGHGDSIEDLLSELEWQIEERVQRVAGRGAN